MTENKNTITYNNLTQELKRRKMPNKLYFFEETTSTFDEAAKLNLSHGDIICAKSQINGRGRMGREWKSEAGGIYFSLILNSPFAADEMQIITIVCALGVYKALSKYTGCRIKWPNDIVSENGKKLCGILSKSVILPGSPLQINVGIGINANNCNFDTSLPYAGSLKTETGCEINENAVLCEVVQSIEKYFGKDVSYIVNEFSEACANIGSNVKAEYHGNGNIIEGKCIGISPDGSLIIKTNESDTVCVNSGEVSVRGIYGYV